MRNYILIYSQAMTLSLLALVIFLGLTKSGQVININGSSDTRIEQPNNIQIKPLTPLRDASTKQVTPDEAGAS